MSKYRVTIVTALALVAFLALAIGVNAEPITLTDYSQIVSDITAGVGAEVPTIALAAAGIGAGLFLLKTGWSVLRRMVK